MSIGAKIVEKTIAFILRYLLRYRLTVIRANLVSSFEYGSKNELQKDIESYYRFLAKVIRQNLVWPTRQLLVRHMHMDPNPALSQWIAEGKSVLVTFGHVGNWEWCGSFLGILYPGRVGALYKKIKSAWLNTLMMRHRQLHGHALIEIGQTAALVKLIQTKAMLILMISDQNPGSDRGIIWVPFLKKTTAFINGPEHLALRYHLPVVYLHCAPRTDGGYDMKCQTIYDGKELVAPGIITLRYAECLEKNIISFRTQWLWSHKRWKRVKPD